MNPDLERARAALFAIPPGLPRDEWHEIGRAAIAAGLTIDDVDTWSAAAENYKGRRDVESAFRTIKPNGKTTAGTLFHHAKLNGWHDTEPHNRATRAAAAPKPEGKASHIPAPTWDACAPATAAHDYIDRKLGLPDGVRVYRGPLSIAGQSCDGALAVPLHTLGGELSTLQLIPAQGKKVFLSGVKLASDACYIVGGDPAKAERIFVCEGIGQAWSAHQATRAPAVVTFGAGRMAGVSKALHEKFPSAKLVLVADRGKETQCAAIAADVSGEYVELPADKPTNFDLNDFHREVRDLRAVANVLAQAKQPKLAQTHLLDHGFWAHDAKVTTALPYVVKGLFGKGQIICFWGAPGGGKSFNVAEMTCCIGAGVRWRNRRVRGGVVVCVVAESARPYIENRIAALIQERPELARAAVFIVPLALDLLHTERGDVDRVIATAKKLAEQIGEVQLIAIDTLAATFGGGDENTPGDMGQYVANVRRIIAETSAAVLIVHHCGKNEAAGMRGHSALLGALDAELAIEGEPGGQRILRTGKVRDGAAFTDLFAFTLRVVELGVDEDNDPVTTCVIDSTDESGTRRARQHRKGAALGKHQQAVLRALEAAGGRIGRVALAHKLKDEGMPRNRVHDAIAGLLDNGMLIAHNDCVPVEVSLQ